ncbi:MAG: hypothetical protein Q8P15_01230 [Nanoarchaeota archaeon]|nr:hypothetical protein [Nanoarchaeota archaeon]
MVKRDEEENKEELQRAREDKQLKIFFVGISLVVVAIFVVILVIHGFKNFEQGGVTFNVVKFCDTQPCLTTYQTSFPVLSEGKPAEYNIYLRNDPRKLKEEIPFEGVITLDIPLKQVIVNISDEEIIDCNKDGGIAIGNLNKIFTISGMKVGKDVNATCDPQGRYMFIQIGPGNSTIVEQTGPACYTISVDNCEILKGTERFMVETFERINKEWL